MEETMMTYVKEEPQVLHKILDEFDYSGLAAHLPKQVKRLLILATGSSYNAALAAKYYIEKTAGIIVSIEEPFNFQHYGTIDETTDCILAISQSGKSTSTINVLEKVANSQIPIVALTNQPDSPLVQQAECLIDLNIGVEKVDYVTKGFSGTILNLFLFACAIGYQNQSITESELKDKQQELNRLIQALPDIIERSETYFSENEAKFTSYNRFVCIAYGANLGIAKEFETKFTETVRLPSAGYELEAYMHGPYLEAQKNHALFFLIDEQAISSRAFRLRNYIEQYVGTTITVVENDTKEAYDFSLKLNDLDPFILPLATVVLVQVWSYLTATANRQDLTIDPFPDFDAMLNSKLL
ncbi:SIS domain-containing protein [Enterococcus pallens]|uniref:SIS domain-containing protein n=1 Tax=Enterococcus pallens ATCC BAA-351 TaxID=1158607 RepID=R2QFH0_9ENTE|nr:SIS domain-containing protein [Enterococcus pallens]EOH95262.1 hypothetical protein UAU_01224 [Enterococcus pallens ATCC BAA-351]EOU21601.1 hypothetical protein I588_02448 [Enterococcus pallens ATCC BAA-351]OJG79757.1 hypothetical protein RV10_GL000545 [Enterococcus pallens]